ncbi:MAG: hypothetical protein BWX66_01948 [Deltaproteobacteria bacterium ADurb.Bin058]|nr:MAG: hypothetical protein BWX66_01948 [Deltaproteobacteria bacterium ADurb.Bin058]
MGQAADLRWNSPGPSEFVKDLQDGLGRLHSVCDRVHPNQRITNPPSKPLHGRGQDPTRIVCGMVRLQTYAMPPPQSKGRVSVSYHTNLGGCQNQVHIGHQLCNSRDAFTGQPPPNCEHILTCRGTGQQMLAKLSHCPVLDFGEFDFIQVVLDQSSHLVLLVRCHRIFANLI